MFRKILIGMLGFLVACGLAAAGYQMGRHLAYKQDNTPVVPSH
jgi:hypothetical protein